MYKSLYKRHLHHACSRTAGSRGLQVGLSKAAPCPQVDVGSLMTGSIMSLVLSCLQSHCTAALRKGWQAAVRQAPEAAASQLRRIHRAAAGEAAEEGAPGDEAPPAEPSELRLEGLWPYWMDRGMQENDVHLHSIALLTGKLQVRRLPAWSPDQLPADACDLAGSGNQGLRQL